MTGEASARRAAHRQAMHDCPIKLCEDMVSTVTHGFAGRLA